MRMALFIKMIYWIRILFPMSKANFLFFSFIETKFLNIHSFTNEN